MKVYNVYDYNLVGNTDCLPHVGTYSTEDIAISKCITPKHFIIPSEIDKELPDNIYDAEYIWFPMAETKVESITRLSELILNNTPIIKLKV